MESESWPHARSYHNLIATDRAQVLAGDQHNTYNYYGQSLEPKQQLLQSLWFEDLNIRRETIKRATLGTLEWIFGSSWPSYTHVDSGDNDSINAGQSDDEATLSPSQNFTTAESSMKASSRLARNSDQDESIQPPRFTDFVTWLREGSSTYWIRGKLGSGKSTLMNHIIDDQRTESNLRYWSRDKKLLILSFFFWRAGSRLQNSICGLLRSLLFQIVEKRADDTQTFENVVGGRSQPWSEHRLVKSIISTITAATEERYCIFIDGLDEFTGQLDELIDLVAQLDLLRNVKCCVSSRPEPIFVQRLSKYYTLQLEHLNYADLQKFVTTKLARVELEHKQRLVDEVVRKSSGVFLWTALVTQELVTGAANGDDYALLLERLSYMPIEMDELFSDMVKSVGPEYRDRFSFLLQLMRLSRQAELDEHQNGPNLLTSVSHLTASTLTEHLKNYDSFSKMCERTEIQVASRSAGLLEIEGTSHRAGDEGVERTQWTEAEYKFGVPGLQPNAASSLSGYAPPVTYDRRQLGDSAPFPTMLLYENRYMTWIHRSAFDYVFSSDQSPWHHLGMNDSSAIAQILQGILHYLYFAPSYSTPDRYAHGFHRLEYIVPDVAKLASKVAAAEKLGTEFLDKLQVLAERMDSREFDGCWNMSKVYLRASGPALGAVGFWLACFSAGPHFSSRAYADIHTYSMKRVDLWVAATPKSFVLSPLNFRALVGFGNLTLLTARSLDVEYKRRHLEGFASSFRTLAFRVLWLVRAFWNEENDAHGAVRRFIPGCTVTEAVEDGMKFFRSVSCRWPNDHTTPTLSYGDAMALFTILDLLDDALDLREEIALADSETVHADINAASALLREFAENFEVCWNMSGTWIGEDPFDPEYVMWELPYLFWRKLNEHLYGNVSASEVQFLWLRDAARIRIVCFPLRCNRSDFEQLGYDRRYLPHLDLYGRMCDDEDEWLESHFATELGISAPTEMSGFKTGDLVLESKQHLELTPRSHTMELLISMLLNGVPKALQEAADVAKICLDPSEHRAWLGHLFEDIIVNEQGLNATQQLFALACVNAEISAMD